VVEIKKDGTKGGDADPSRDQHVPVSRIADHEIAIRLAHFDGRANRELSEGALEAAAPSAGEARGEHDVSLEGHRRDREVPSDPSIVRVRVREAIVKELASLPFEGRVAPEQKRCDVLGFGSLRDKGQLHTYSFVCGRRTARPATIAATLGKAARAASGTGIHAGVAARLVK
jgi:hypothetical protein